MVVSIKLGLTKENVLPPGLFIEYIAIHKERKMAKEKRWGENICLGLRTMQLVYSPGTRVGESSYYHYSNLTFV